MTVMEHCCTDEAILISPEKYLFVLSYNLVLKRLSTEEAIVGWPTLS
jgi:hypothetical protein